MNFMLCYYSYQIYDLFSIWTQPIICFDGFLFSYNIIRLATIGLLLLCCANFCSLLYVGHISECNRILSELAVNVTKKFNWTHTIKLNFFLQEHVRISTLVKTVNRELWAKVLFISLSVHLPVNVYLVHRLREAKHIFGVEALVSWTILLIQIVIVTASILPLAHSSKVLHQSARVLPKIQQLIPVKFLHYKLKYCELYERINTDTQQYGITIGPTKPITYTMAAEIALLYVAFVFKVLDFFL